LLIDGASSGMGNAFGQIAGGTSRGLSKQRI
jgi:hypothetical protein